MRGKIGGLSERSGTRLREVMDNAGPEVLPWKALAHLTYPKVFPTDGREVKRHLDMFGKRMHRMRAIWPRFCGLWIMEFQPERGAPHIHALMNVRLGYELLSDWWYEIVDSGDPLHLKAGTSIEEPRKDLASYFLKTYLAKGDQKVVPAGFTNPGRFWGKWGKFGGQLGQVEIPEAEGLKIKQAMRRCVEAGLAPGRRLPRRVREGEHTGVTMYEGGEKEMTRLLYWAAGEVKAGR